MAVVLRAMFMHSRKRLVAAVILLPVVLFIGSNLINALQETVASKSQELQRSKQPSPIRKPPAVVKQLESEAVVPPVELQRPSASLSAENQLEQYSCIVKNNTSKAVVAFSLAWTIIIESGGKKSSVTELQVIDSFVHPDFRESSLLRSISPGAESVAESGPTYFGSDASVKRVQVSIDYVEFDGGTSLGPNTDGRSSKQIALVREGATSYKEWLVQMYENSRGSLNLVVQQLQSESIPETLKIGNAQMQGAYAYRKRLLDLYKNRGPAGIEKYLNR